MRLKIQVIANADEVPNSTDEVVMGGGYTRN